MSQISQAANNSLPIALLVIYDKGFKFKYKKYYLRKGNNYIGSSPSCHVVMQQGQQQKIADRAAVLTITDELATIQPLKPACVCVLSNIKKKNNLMVQLSAGTKYVIEMEKDFIIAGRKAIMQISTIQQLLQVKGVINESMFILNKDTHEKSQRNYQFMQNQGKNQKISLVNSQFQATIPISQGYNFQATIPLDNNYEYEATQLINQPNYESGYDATLPLDADYDLIPQSYQRNSEPKNSQSSFRRDASLSLNQSKRQQMPTSLQKVQNSQNLFRKQTKNNNDDLKKVISQAQISMPSTIKQQQMPATIKQDVPSPSRNDHMMNSFPPTIQQSQPQQKEIKKKPPNLTKSQPVYRQMKNQKIQNVQLKPFHSLEQKNQHVPQSFQDLFGQQNLGMPNKSISMKFQTDKKDKLQNQVVLNKEKKLKQTKSENVSQKTQKLASDQQFFNQAHNKEKAIKNDKKNNLHRIQQVHNDSSKKSLRKYFLLGKLSKFDIEKLKKKGYQKLQQQSEENIKEIQFDLLLIQGQLKISKILMISLVKGKEIKPITWINNSDAKFSGKLQGFLWQSIDKRKGKANTIFNNGKNFYIQQNLRELYQEVMQVAGATLIGQLTKPRSKMTIYIILDQKSSEGRQLYQQKKNYKNWSFYSKKMIIQSILMGEEIIDKYKLDGYSF